MAAHEVLERHEQHAGAAHLGPMARRAAVVVAVLAALLAVSEMRAESSIKENITAETRLVDVNVRAAIERHEPEAELAGLEHERDHAEAQHSRYEISTVVLQVAIVLVSVSVVTAAAWLLGLGGLAGLAGAVVLLLALLDL